MSKPLFNLSIVALVILVAATDVRGQDVKVTISNADEIVAAFPDTTLVKDVLKPIDRDLWSIEFHRGSRAASPTSHVLQLIKLAAPEGVAQYRLQNERGTPVLTIGPVPDFEGFLESIDYGEVVSSDASKRRVHVKIDVAEVLPDQLIARAERKGGNEADRTEFMLGSRKRSSSRSEEEIPTDRLGANYDPGDYVEILIGKQPLYGTVEELEVGSFDRLQVKVRLLDLAKLMKLAEKKSHRTRLERAGEFVFWAPAQRLRKLPGPPTPDPEERTWADTTGKYKIVATYGGVEGDRVLLKRAGGKITKVPLAKLCEADRSYVEGFTSNDANPFAAKVSVAGGTLRADWSRVKAIRNVASRKWRWKPPEVPALATAGAPSGESIDLDTPAGASVEEFYVSADGRSALVQMEAGIGPEERVYFQHVDLTSGALSGLAECPVNSEVLDARPEDRAIVLSDDRNHKGAHLYIKRVGDGELTSVCDFNAASPDNFHKDIQGARLLAGSRLLTYGLSGSAAIWDYTTAKAIYSLKDLDGIRVPLAVGPMGRFLFADMDRSINIIDLDEGKQVASFPYGVTHLKRLQVDARLNRLAILAGNDVYSIDLNKGEDLHGVLGLARNGDVDFIGRMWLVGNRFLIDPQYPLLLWQYVMNSDRQYDSHTAVRGKRMWYVAREGSGDNATWSVVSIPLPHDKVRAKLAEIGDPNGLIILQGGDEVLLVVDTDLDAGQEAKLREAATKAFTASGYKVVDETTAGADTKEAVVTCKRAAPVEVKIANPKAKRPKDSPNAFRPPRGFAIPRMSSPGFIGPHSTNWMYESHTITPYNSTLSIRHGGDVLWTDGAEVKAGQQYHPVADGSVQDVIRRLTSPNIERLMAIQLPGQMCKTGPIGGTFGASLLDADGIFKDITDPKQLEE